MIDLVVVQEIESEKEILQEVKPSLEACVHGLPPIGDIQRQIDLIPSLILLNKPTYRMSHKENEELKRQVDDLLDKGLIQEIKFHCVVPTPLAPNKEESWRMCVDFQPINNLFVHEEVRFDIGQRIKQYEDQESEGYQRLVFDSGGRIRLHMIKERFLMQGPSKFHARARNPSRIINKIGENGYKLKLLDHYDTSPIFNVNDLWPHQGEYLRASLFSQLWGIDAKDSSTYVGN